MVEVALKEANEASARAQMGFVWTLMHMDGEDREAGLLDHRFFLVLTIDPVKARKYMQSQKKPPVQIPPVERASPEEIEAASRASLGHSLIIMLRTESRGGSCLWKSKTFNCMLNEAKAPGEKFKSLHLKCVRRRMDL